MLLLLRIKSVLIVLFAFELVILKLFLAYMFLSSPFEFTPILVFLAVAAGEARLGLSLLVSILRNRGSDSGTVRSVSSIYGY